MYQTFAFHSMLAYSACSMAQKIFRSGVTGLLHLIVLIYTLDPPQPLKDQRDETLRECGHKLLRILIDHHRSQIS